jgi:hypothetical protein
MIPCVAICLTSHDRIDCTRINQEIFKLNFTHSYIVVHASSGARAASYLEDAFVPCAPKPHIEGALELMQSVIRAALPFEPDFFVLLDGDTWLLDEGILIELIHRLHSNPSLLMATCSWLPLPGSIVRLLLELADIARVPGERVRRLSNVPHRMAYDAVSFSTQFCILRNHGPLVETFLGMSRHNRGLLKQDIERQWFDRFSVRFGLEQVLRITEREPVIPDNRFICKRLALYSQHWPAAGTSTGPTDKTDPMFVSPGTPGKREALHLYPNIRRGESIQRLLNATELDDLAYYNAGARRY